MNNNYGYLCIFVKKEVIVVHSVDIYRKVCMLLSLIVLDDTKVSVDQ